MKRKALWETNKRGAYVVPDPPLKEKTLLRRFRWPLFVTCFSGAHIAGLAFYYGDKSLTIFGLVLFFIGAGICVVLNTIDETEQKIR